MCARRSHSCYGRVWMRGVPCPSETCFGGKHTAMGASAAHGDGQRVVRGATTAITMLEPASPALARRSHRANTATRCSRSVCPLPRTLGVHEGCRGLHGDLFAEEESFRNSSGPQLWLGVGQSLACPWFQSPPALWMRLDVVHMTPAHVVSPPPQRERQLPQSCRRALLLHALSRKAISRHRKFLRARRIKPSLPLEHKGVHDVSRSGSKRLRSRARRSRFSEPPFRHLPFATTEVPTALTLARFSAGASLPHVCYPLCFANVSSLVRFAGDARSMPGRLWRAARAAA